MDIQSYRVQSQGFGHPIIHEKRLMISLSDAVADPRAVVVVDGNAAVADRAMVDARGLHYFAGGALFAIYLIFVD